jgi:uncharacterized membrane protein
VEEILRQIAATVASACEFMAVLFVAAGAAEAVWRTLAGWRAYSDLDLKKTIWRRFAASLVLALEFALAGDIVRTASAPTWQDIGELGAIAAIRTFLSIFLERDIEAERGLARAAAPIDANTGSSP